MPPARGPGPWGDRRRAKGERRERVMRRLPEGGTRGALLIASVIGLFAWPQPGSADERTMRFRPVPAESATTFDHADMAAARDRQAAADSAVRRSRAPRAIPAIPEPPNPEAGDNAEPPPPPEAPEPSVRTTSGDIVRFGSDITIKPGQLIEGDVVSFGGEIEVLGHVTGNVSAMGGNVSLAPSARVDGDVVCIGGTLTEEPGSSVGGQRVDRKSVV